MTREEAEQVARLLAEREQLEEALTGRMLDISPCTQWQSDEMLRAIRRAHRLAQDAMETAAVALIVNIDGELAALGVDA